MSNAANNERSSGVRVTITGAGNRVDRVYHTDPNCDHGPSNGSRVLLSSLTDDYRECTYCAGEYEAATDPDFSYFQAAIDHGESDE